MCGGTVWDEGVESVGSYFDMMVMNERRYCWHHHGHDGCRQAIFKGRRGIVLVLTMRWAQGGLRMMLRVILMMKLSSLCVGDTGRFEMEK
jgi:hypothetical protein